MNKFIMLVSAAVLVSIVACSAPATKTVGSGTVDKKPAQAVSK